jgi:hypothetical protein
MKTSKINCIAFTACILLIFSESCAYRGKTMSSQGKAMSDALVEVSKKHLSDPFFMIRYNPPRCECAEFEVMLDDIWYRVMLTTGRISDEEYQKFMTLAQNELKENKIPRYKVKGVLKKSPLQCKSGSFYYLLEMEELMP